MTRAGQAVRWAELLYLGSPLTRADRLRGGRQDQFVEEALCRIESGAVSRLMDQLSNELIRLQVQIRRRATAQIMLNVNILGRITYKNRLKMNTCLQHVADYGWI